MKIVTESFILMNLPAKFLQFSYTIVNVYIMRNKITHTKYYNL